MSNRAARGRRDDSLRRVRSLTKGAAVGVVAAVAALGLYVANALPGHSATPASQTTATTTPPPTTAPSSGSSAPAATNPTVTAPTSPPVTTPRPVHVTTGAS